MKFRSLSLGLMTVLMASAATAAVNTSGNWYGGISGDGSWIRHDDIGGGGDLQLGYRTMQSTAGDIRLEAEAGYHGANGKDGYGSTQYAEYMGNLYYDIGGWGWGSGGSRIAPYIGGGLGAATVRFGNADGSHDWQNRFAYQGMAGLTMVSASLPSTEWSLGYRYTATSGRNINSNNVELGARFNY